MSTFKYKLKGARWLRMYTAAEKSSVYAVQSEAQKIADTLCDVPWTRAKSDGPAMFPLTDAKTLDENPANRDLFDAALFCAEHSDGAHRAYANAAMYLFKLPSTSGVNLNSVTVHVESDAYNALGARIAVHLLSSAELPTVCATVRTGAAHAEGVAPRRTEERNGRNYWYSNSADVTITGGTTESPAVIGNLTQYLAVFVGMENYATSRNEWLEGASYIRNLIEIETDAVVTGWTDGAATEFNVTRAMAAHGRQGRTFKFAAERLSNGWKVPEAIAVRSFAQPTTTAVALNGHSFDLAASIPALSCSVFVQNIGYKYRVTSNGNSWQTNGNATRAFTFFMRGGNLFAMCHTSGGSASTQQIVAHYIPIDPVDSFDMVEANSQRADANAEIERQLLASEAWVALRTGKARSIAADYVGEIHFSNTADGPQGVWLYFVLLVGMDDGVRTLGVVELAFSASGSSTLSSDIYFASGDALKRVGGPATIFPLPNANSIADAAGRADLLLPSVRSRDYNFSFTYTSGSTRQTMSIQKVIWIDNGTVCVGLDGNKLTVNGQEIPVDGSICGICRVYDGSHRAFAVYGDLVSVGGVLCRNMAVVTVDSGIDISVPSFDASITPDTYGHYRITSTPTAKNGYLITGDFESLGSTAYHGHAKIWTSNGNLVVAADNLINVANASTAHPTDSQYLYGGLSCLWMTGGYSSSSVYKSGDLPATEADAAATTAGLRAVYGDVYDGMLAPTGETADGAGFEVACAARTFALSTGSSATRKVWTVDASALLVPFSAPTGFRATKVRLDWSATAADPNGLASIVTGDAVPAPKFALWLMRGRRVEEADGLTARELWDASAGESGGWELVGTVAASDTTATLDLACPLADAVGTFLLTAWAPQDGLNPAAESTVDETTTPATVTEYGVSGWRPDITLIG